ncbi:MAG: PLDc_N domain-containing protein [Bacteroidales bacterium]|nr:PLDc_N domain-containing protein [Bacteroidales bacterium]
MMGLPVLIILAIILLPVIAFINLLMSRFKNSTDKVIWLIVIIFIPILGSLLYFLIAPNQKVN